VLHERNLNARPAATHVRVDRQDALDDSASERASPLGRADSANGGAHLLSAEAGFGVKGNAKGEMQARRPGRPARLCARRPVSCPSVSGRLARPCSLGCRQGPPAGPLSLPALGVTSMRWLVSACGLPTHTSTPSPTLHGGEAFLSGTCAAQEAQAVAKHVNVRGHTRQRHADPVAHARPRCRCAPPPVRPAARGRPRRRRAPRHGPLPPTACAAVRVCRPPGRSTAARVGRRPRRPGGLGPSLRSTLLPYPTPARAQLQDAEAGQLLPRTMPAPAASPTQRALRFVRSRDGRLALLSMALLVFQGTALSLTLRVSRRAPRPRPALPCFGRGAAPQGPCAPLLPCAPGGLSCGSCPIGFSLFECRTAVRRAFADKRAVNRSPLHAPKPWQRRGSGRAAAC